MLESEMIPSLYTAHCDTRMAPCDTWAPSVAHATALRQLLLWIAALMMIHLPSGRPKSSPACRRCSSTGCPHPCRTLPMERTCNAYATLVSLAVAPI